MTAVDDSQRRRNRRTLVIIALLFLGSMALAGLLRFADIHPAASRQKGELLDPYGDLRDYTPRLLDGGSYAWNPASRQWRVLVAAPADCGEECRRVARDVGTVWQLMSKDADRVDVLWWCASTRCAWPAEGTPPSTLRLLAPDARARARLPKVDAGAGVPVYVVDPNGFVILRYAPGSDLAGVRTDLSRLLKLR
ncbi:hypothetical protein [Lysobacter sp. N42]|jgi:hypothetical protein|uniref:hypothetical protein n=1 Tax=Lysobacter sp. N42 TaxID=2545719 RepID=UPI00104690CB|nr:hypothetical protein [Lysobacter sp. N42]TCZ87252.1 hypothetical protein EYQ95_17030 [Lysobacter sp. N42]